MRTTLRVVALVAATAWTAAPLNAQKVRQQSAMAQPSAETQAARPLVDAANMRAMEAFNRGDAAAFAMVYAPDAELLPPNAPAVQGRDAIQNLWQGYISGGVRNLKLTTEEFAVSGDYGIEIGTYSIDIQPEGAAPMQDHGKFMVLWQRDASGAWHWYRDIYNSDLPAR